MKSTEKFKKKESFSTYVKKKIFRMAQNDQVHLESIKNKIKTIIKKNLQVN